MARKNPFHIQPFDDSDKDIIIHGPNELYILVDYSDVDHDAVEKAVVQIVQILNNNWTLYKK